jgi:hypothetical protein
MFDSCGRYFFFGTHAVTLTIAALVRQASKIKIIANKSINNSIVFESIGVVVKSVLQKLL